jgi:GTPase Era involved in 16S rRNA processing
MITAVEGFKELEFQLYGEMIQLRELHKALKNEQEVEQITKMIETLKTRTFRVAVVGEFKRGKSSLINALLGSVILPADVTPATATINRITYGTSPGITVCYHDGTCENIDINHLADYVTMLTPEGLQRALTIREAIVHYPTPFCQNHIELIDTPGLSDNDRMTGITMNLLGDVDAAIVVISALAPFSQTEAGFVADLILSEKQTNLVFVVTYIDEVDEDRQDEMVQTIHKRIRDNVLQVVQKNQETTDKAEEVQMLLQNAPIFGVSSKLALKAFISSSSRMLKESRFEPFKEELYKILTAKQGIHTLNLSVDTILSSCDTYEASADAELARIDHELDTRSEILREIGKYNSKSVTEVLETFKKVKEGLSEEIKKSCNQMRDLFLKKFQEIFSPLQHRTDLTSFEIQKAVSEVSFKC